jgi:hypothetical protein
MKHGQIYAYVAAQDAFDPLTPELAARLQGGLKVQPTG